MYVKPFLVSKEGLTSIELREDKEACAKFEGCGVGKKAVYLSAFGLDRIRYIPFSAIDRVFKRVAISKGGYTGKGAYAAMAYFVVAYDHGDELAVSIKDEDIVDDIIEAIHTRYPDLPTMSSAAEAEYKKAKAYKEAFVYPDINPGQMEELMRLKSVKEYLEKRQDLCDNLAKTAKDKRLHGKLESKHRFFAAVVYGMGLITALIGVNSIINGYGFEFWFAAFAIAILFVIIASRIVPTAQRNVDAINDAYENAVSEMGEYVAAFGPLFPVPPKYAHPIVIERMREAIRLDRAQECDAALRIIKDDLKKLNRDVTVDQEEFDQVVVVKPLFLVADYQ